MNYPMYNNSQYFMNDLQAMRDRIDKQMQQIQQQNQMQQAQQIPQVTQNFQLAPNPTNNELESKYANNIDEVKNTFVMKTGVFLDKDFKTLWIKDVTGNIRTFKTEEIFEIDEKDKQINELKKQLEEMKGMIANANEPVNANINDEIAETKPTRIQSSKRSNAK